MANAQVSSTEDDRDFVAPVLNGVPHTQFRPETADDLPFLRALYASTRETELAATDWSAAQKADFLHMQFGLQHRYYSEHFTDAAFDIVQHAGQDIGRRYVLRRPDALTLIDMALLPQWRGQGIGTVMLEALLMEARATGRQLLLHVDHDNPARRMYLRAGFQEIGDNGVYSKMRWHAAAATPSLAQGTVTS